MSTIHPALSGFVNNALYVSPEVIYADLKRIFKQKNIELGDIIEWCARVETLHLADVDKMFYYEADEFIVTDRMVMLPCHLHSLLDVYSNPNTSNSILSVQSNGSYLYGFPDSIKDGDTIYLNYIGICVTDEGVPLVMKTHEEAVGFFCRCRLFEEDLANGEISPQTWGMWDMKFNNACQASKQDMRNYQRKDFNNLHKIRGAMINRLGQTTLRNNLYY